MLNALNITGFIVAAVMILGPMSVMPAYDEGQSPAPQSAAGGSKPAQAASGTAQPAQATSGSMQTPPNAPTLVPRSYDGSVPATVVIQPSNSVEHTQQGK